MKYLGKVTDPKDLCTKEYADKKVANGIGATAERSVQLNEDTTRTTINTFTLSNPQTEYDGLSFNSGVGTDPYPAIYPPQSAVLDGKYATTMNEASFACGRNAFAHGHNTVAHGDCSEAGGESCVAAGGNSRAFGRYTLASGFNSLAEGWKSIASGNNSRAGGYNNEAAGSRSYANGVNTVAYGENSFTSGEGNIVGIKGFKSILHGKSTLYFVLDSVTGISVGDKFSACNAATGKSWLNVGTVTAIDTPNLKITVSSWGDMSYASTSTEAYVFFIDKPKIGTHILNSDINGVDNYGFNSAVFGKNNVVIGQRAFSNGFDCQALSNNSFTSGYKNIASGAGAMANGNTSVASGGYSFTSGYHTTASGDYSHAEGIETSASATSSHAEGGCTKASGSCSHAEGGRDPEQLSSSNVQYLTIASGISSHAEGISQASGDAAHAEGYYTIASVLASHAEGCNTTASGEYSHAEGCGTTASGMFSHAEGGFDDSEGPYTTASGDSSHAEGRGTTAVANYSHAEGWGTRASAPSSHAEGRGTTAVANYSHAEGYYTIASGLASHAEGESTTASGECSHAEGDDTTASGSCSHAEGESTEASGSCSHAEGSTTTASGSCSHAEGESTTASGSCSHAEGYNTTAQRQSQHVSGEYNVLDTGGSGTTTRGNYALIVGNGTGTSARSNALALGWSGNLKLNGNVYVECNADSSGGTMLATESYVDNHHDSTKQNTLSSAQLNAVNSGITSSKVSTYDGYATTKQNKLTAGENITIENNVISAVGTGEAVWGNITGTLSNQTDLNTALSGKQNTLIDGDFISIDNDEISVVGTPLPDEATAGNGMVHDGISWELQSGYGYVTPGDRQVLTYNGDSTGKTLLGVDFVLIETDPTPWPEDLVGCTCKYKRNNVESTITIQSSNIVQPLPDDMPDYYLVAIGDGPTIPLLTLLTDDIEMEGEIYEAGLYFYDRNIEYPGSNSYTSYLAVGSEDVVHQFDSKYIPHDSTKQDTLTSTQLSAVNSGITSAKVSTYDGYASTISGKEAKGKMTISGTEYTVAKHTLSITEGGVTTTYQLLGV